MIRVLFVCLGNICRSPMAEAIFRDLLKKEELSDKIKTDSAGLGHWHIGKPPHQGTLDKLAEQRISSENLFARQFQKQDFADFDYIIAMDHDNMTAITSFGEEITDTKIARLMDYADNPAEADVPDPYITGNFDYTYQLVSEGCRTFLNYIKNNHYMIEE